ncbi:hypothetical protein BDY19DRAFT_996943 [Irpex rosettiformis]|uniref:Uncharacterized protein n=1 Tax=Irpex rosettiformis TaxID=378272 RepID=A0ACB8TT41_9APHY|nr:hypothetical protein BDY19DRAFT_996943 [Irpex rosettiformis]
MSTTHRRRYSRVKELNSNDSLELQHLHLPSTSSDIHNSHANDYVYHSNSRFSQQRESAYLAIRKRERVFWDRLRGKGRRVPGIGRSLKNILLCSWLNVLLPIVPLAWISHYFGTQDHWPIQVTFALCFVAVMPLERLFDWGAEQMALYLGKDLGDLLTITMNKWVLGDYFAYDLHPLTLRLLQSTLIGVVILHLLLIPGTAFLTGSGGARVWEQDLHPHSTQLNHSLLAIGVLAILLPTAFFASLDRGAQSVATNGVAEYSGQLITDKTRGEVLQMSRALAILLLIIYVFSRVFLHNPPGEGNAFKVAQNAPDELKHEEHVLTVEDPEINPWVCIVLLLFTVAIMSVTVQFLVSSIESVRETVNIQEEWFGLILLPFASFSADGLVAVAYFARSSVNHVLGRKTMIPSSLAKGRAIDLSIQFTLFWMPLLVLIGWWIGKPMHLLFDYYELAIILGSCFLVNYVTADSKTNWVEGLIMVCFYVMIAVCAWFYVGQPELEAMLSCPGSVAQALSGESGGEVAAEAGGGEAEELAVRFLKTMLR